MVDGSMKVFKTSLKITLLTLFLLGGVNLTSNMVFRVGGVKLPPPSISWFSSTPAEIGLNSRTRTRSVKVNSRTRSRTSSRSWLKSRTRTRSVEVNSRTRSRTLSRSRSKSR